LAGNTLIIVESAAKAKTIGKFLGKNYRIKASVGHIKDLPKSKLGIDIDNDFEPQYITIRGKGEVLKEIKDESSKSNRVLLATDPDREGEAIAWHLQKAIKIPDGSKCRIEFNEITKEAVKNAIKNARPIDMNRVNAQQARRILDRLLGYNLSPLLWSKIRKGLSAGRVQSVALRLICEREEEIKNFQPVEYWTMEALVADRKKNSFNARVAMYKNERLEIKSEAQKEEIEKELKKARLARKYAASLPARPPPITFTALIPESPLHNCSLGSGRAIWGSCLLLLFLPPHHRIQGTFPR
jgi:DNA topoisomerase-1